MSSENDKGNSDPTAESTTLTGKGTMTKVKAPGASTKTILEVVINSEQVAKDLLERLS